MPIQMVFTWCLDLTISIILVIFSKFGLQNMAHFLFAGVCFWCVLKQRSQNCRGSDFRQDIIFLTPYLCSITRLHNASYRILKPSFEKKGFLVHLIYCPVCDVEKMYLDSCSDTDCIKAVLLVLPRLLDAHEIRFLFVEKLSCK